MVSKDTKTTLTKHGTKYGFSDLSCVLIAAGISKRMEGLNKLKLVINEETILTRSTKTALSTGFGEIVVVLGGNYLDVKDELANLGAKVVCNEDYLQGQSTSVNTGLRVLSKKFSGVFVCLADQPLITPKVVKFIGDKFLELECKKIVVPTFNGVRGNPIVVPSSKVDEILSGGLRTSCRHMVKKYPDEVFMLAMQDDSVVFDIDTKKDYEVALRRLSSDDSTPAAHRRDYDIKEVS